MAECVVAAGGEEESLRRDGEVVGHATSPPCPKPLTVEGYWAFCIANPDLDIERTAGDEIIITPPCGGETSYRKTIV